MRTIAGSEAEYIGADRSLRAACRRWATSPVLALDTEFMRERTFYAKPALVQVSDGAWVGVIDPLAIKDLSPLAERVGDPGVTKILHACREDLEVIDQLLGVLPEPLFDTQLAASLKGMARDVGYAELVLRTLDIALDKSQSRTDWLKRPLSLLQLRYAVADVEHLPKIHDLQKAELKRLGRTGWLREDCEQLLSRARSRERVDSYYQRVFAQLPMADSSLALLRNLSRWRERRVREIDIPRPWLLTDKQMCSIAKQRPATRQALSQLLGSSRKPGALKAVLDIVAAADDPPERQPARRNAPRERVNAMLKRVAEVAQQRGLMPTVLATRGECAELLAGHLNGREATWPERLRGWRRGLLGDGLLDAAP